MNEQPIEPTEADFDPFEDADILMALREFVTECLVVNNCTIGNNSGCGCGSAEIDMEFEGIKFQVSISLIEVEH